MTINGIDISVYNARQWRVTSAKRQISNESEMLDGFSVPVLVRPVLGLKEWKVDIDVHGETRADIWANCSKILRLFEGIATVRLDGFEDRIFEMTLSGVEHSEYGERKDRWAVLSLSLAGYEHGPTVEAWFYQKFSFSASETEKVAEIRISDLINEFPRHLKMETAVVPLDIYVEQIYTDSTGYRPPLDEEIEISGIVKNRDGVDLGDVRIFSNAFSVGSSYAGAVKARIEGRTGRQEFLFSDGSNASENTKFSGSVDLPYVPSIGHKGQDAIIRIKSRNIFGKALQKEIGIGFSYTAVYM